MAANHSNDKPKKTMTSMVATITKEKIYNLMNKITVIVSAGFLVKNVIGQEWIGAIGISGIEGDFYNVMGLPLHHLYRELKNLTI